MKKIILFILLWSALSFGQEPATIKTVGRAVFTESAPKFTASVVISPYFASNPIEPTNMAQLEAKYDEALKKNGLALSQFKENLLGYYLLGYVQEGTLYTYETTSIENFQRFLASNSYGTQRSDYGYSITMDTKQTAELAQVAIDNARRKADAIAKKMGRLLGQIVSVEDNNLPDIALERSLYNDKKIGEYEYDVTVVFALK